MRTPDNPADLQQHWQSMSPISDVLSRQTRHAMVAVAEEVANNPIDASPYNAYQFAYGRHSVLPPALLADITPAAIDVPASYEISRTRFVRQRSVRRYVRWADSVEKYVSGSFSLHEKLLGKTMAGLAGTAYPKDNWWLAAHEIQRCLRNEPIFMLDVHCANQIINSDPDEVDMDFPGAWQFRGHASYVVSQTRHVSPDRQAEGVRDFVQLPITQYGIGAAAKLACNTVAICDRIKLASHIWDTVDRSFDAKDKIHTVRKYTARTESVIAHKDSPIAHVDGMLSSLCEGFVSIAQSLSFMSARVVPGYETADELIAALLAQRMPEKFARLVGAGFIGPKTLAGLYVPDVIKADKYGTLALSENAKRTLKEYRESRRMRSLKEWNEHKTKREVEQPGQLGLVCPAARPNGAISIGSRIMQELYTA